MSYAAHFSRAFAAGLFGSLFLFIAANFYSYRQMSCALDDGFCGFGFPFELYETGGYATVTRLVWCGFIADAFIAVAASFVIGAICDRVFAAHNIYD
jgi:hypothetical protein